MRDVCGKTRHRCPTAEKCNLSTCAYDRGLYPIDERRLSKDELYQMQMQERRAAAATPAHLERTIP